MPRGRGRGGSRNGQVGKSYQNRKDLNGAIPKATATGQAYGAAKAQMDAQSAVPMGTPEVAPASFQGLPPEVPRPGAMGDLFADSTAPDEHVMNGATLGPGLGPAALGIRGAGDPDPEDLVKMARWLPALEEIANRPTSTTAMRQVVRTLKSRISMAAPPGGA
jgi:hypothetical protein